MGVLAKWTWRMVCRQPAIWQRLRLQEGESADHFWLHTEQLGSNSHAGPEWWKTEWIFWKHRDDDAQEPRHRRRCFSHAYLHGTWIWLRWVRWVVYWTRWRGKQGGFRDGIRPWHHDICQLEVLHTIRECHQQRSHNHWKWRSKWVQQQGGISPFSRKDSIYPVELGNRDVCHNGNRHQYSANCLRFLGQRTWHWVWYIEWKTNISDSRWGNYRRFCDTGQHAIFLQVCPNWKPDHRMLHFNRWSWLDSTTQERNRGYVASLAVWREIHNWSWLGCIWWAHWFWALARDDWPFPFLHQGLRTQVPTGWQKRLCPDG